jgi:hypothetical protein
VEPLTPAELTEVYARRQITTPQAPPVLPPAEGAKPVDLIDHDIFTVDGEVVDGPGT